MIKTLTPIFYRTSLNSINNFCTFNPTNACANMEDWQYVSKINEFLNKGETNTAFNYLIKVTKWLE